MSLKHPGRIPSKSTRGGGFMAFFEIRCASCGKKGLSTTGGKHTSASAGYCRACGVFVGYECAGKTGWHGWKRTCPACGKVLRTNDAFLRAIIISLTLGLMAIGLIPAGITMIGAGDIEKALTEMPVTDLGDISLGAEVKVVGTITNATSPTIECVNTGTTKYSKWVWQVQDFELNCSGGNIWVRGSDLSGPEQNFYKPIIGADGSRKGYNVGDRVAVVGIARSLGSLIIIAPNHMAPGADAFQTGNTANGWGIIVVVSPFPPILLISILMLRRRYHSHRVRQKEYRQNMRLFPRLAPDPAIAIHSPPRVKKRSNRAENLLECPLCGEVVRSSDTQCSACGAEFED
jgi:hypothetical protein